MSVDAIIAQKIAPIHNDIFLNFNIKGLKRVIPENVNTSDYITIMQFYMHKDNINKIFKAWDDDEIDIDKGMYRSHLVTYKEIFIIFCKADEDDQTIAVILAIKKE